MNQGVFRPFEGDTFHFRCHKGIACFNQCCAGLNLVLTPYNIRRMKNRLGLRSDDFLDAYTETGVQDRSRFPMVKLKMSEDERRTCPFVTPQGCGIYEDRPAACRLYPLGRAFTAVEGEKEEKEKFFVVNESHCLGFEEDQSWTLKEWLEHEGVKEYNAQNHEWTQIITSSKGLGTQDPTRKYQMFFMASYNLDKFREFVLKSRFLSLFEIPSDLKKEISTNDPALLKLAFRWLKFSLFGEKTLALKT